MKDRELAYRFGLQLDANPEQLWPLVSDTNRFNRDAGVPAVEELGVGDNVRRRLRLTRLGVAVEWEEEPFEWVSPHRFSVARRYTRGPVASIRTTATLEARDGGTRLVYEIHATPRGLLGRPAVALQVGLISRRRFASVFRAYDRAALVGSAVLPTPKPHLATGAAVRIAASRKAMLAAGAVEKDVDRLCALVTEGDELKVTAIRPYALADEWGRDRREVLELCLQATRQGLLELRWDPRPRRPCHRLGQWSTRNCRETRPRQLGESGHRARPGGGAPARERLGPRAPRDPRAHRLERHGDHRSRGDRPAGLP
jgi:adenylate cyclase